MVADVVIFITLHIIAQYYCLCSLYCALDLWIIYYLLQVCALKHHHSYLPTPQSLGNHHFTVCVLQT